MHNLKDAEIDDYKSSFPVHCGAGNIKMLSTEGFFLPSERKDLLQQKVNNEVSALATILFSAPLSKQRR